MEKGLLCGLAVLCLGLSGTAWADLCPNCKKMMFTADIGKCVKCGGATSSGAHKLCPTCSKKLGRCEHCRAPLRLDPKTAARVKALKAAVHAFTLELRFIGPSDKPFPGLTLRVAFPKEGPVPMGVQITKTEARAIIDHLAASGFLSKAINVAQVDIRPPRGPTYTLRIAGPDNLALFQSLGWNAKMIERLEGLRTALTGDAAKGMDAVLARLAGLKKQWNPRR